MNEDPFKNKQEKIPIKVEVANSEKWESLKELRLEAITGKDTAMFGITSEQISAEQVMSEEEWRKEMEGDNFTVLSWNDSQAVGMGCVAKQEDGAWRLRRAYVKPEFRNQGIDKKMFAVRMNEIIRRGGLKAVTIIKRDNTASFHIAEKFGFKPSPNMPEQFKKMFANEYYYLESDLTDKEVIKTITDILNAG